MRERPSSLTPKMVECESAAPTTSEGAKAPSLLAPARESNRGDHVWFLADEEELLTKLASRSL